MRKYFVTYDVAKTLHKLGFSRHCIAWYKPFEETKTTNND